MASTSGVPGGQKFSYKDPYGGTYNFADADPTTPPWWTKTPTTKSPMMGQQSRSGQRAARPSSTYAPPAWTPPEDKVRQYQGLAEPAQQRPAPTNMGYTVQPQAAPATMAQVRQTGAPADNGWYNNAGLPSNTLYLVNGQWQNTEPVHNYATGAPPTGSMVNPTTGAVASPGAPSGPVNTPMPGAWSKFGQQWYNEFSAKTDRPLGTEKVQMTPDEYYRGNTDLAQQDLAWGAQFADLNGRPPNEEEWKYHWFSVRGMRPDGTWLTNAVPSNSPQQQWASNPSNSPYASPGPIYR